MLLLEGLGSKKTVNKRLPYYLVLQITKTMISQMRDMIHK